ncbi:helix-turn-helix domain-containing protein [Rodentibacter heidelbergensis]|uniref:Transcriptional regulator n=1 Tax=Rodentibacter heidelbergensis TaxID=1908258 RepID=A0A1V3IBS4_9PAST|nr:helix-turn-helix domain-containing protein [Rodentibacter heidelbergensis]OOF37205.1 transcriptional regulator [Rodentibacter heidelbergensis]
MKIRTEKEKFGERLHLALNQANLAHLKVSEIAVKFNLRHSGEAVTNQAVHKWLNGLAIPSPEKIDTLAKWLDVSPQWLRYGVSDEEQQDLTELDNLLLTRFLTLSEPQKKLILEVINHFKIDNEH